MNKTYCRNLPVSTFRKEEPRLYVQLAIALTVPSMIVAIRQAFPEACKPLGAIGQRMDQTIDPTSIESRNDPAQ